MKDEHDLYIEKCEKDRDALLTEWSQSKDPERRRVLSARIAATEQFLDRLRRRVEEDREFMLKVSELLKRSVLGLEEKLGAAGLDEKAREAIVEAVVRKREEKK